MVRHKTGKIKTILSFYVKTTLKEIKQVASIVASTTKTSV